MRSAQSRVVAAVCSAVVLSACSKDSKAGGAGDSSAATVAAAAKPQTTKGDLPVSTTVVWTPLLDAGMTQWRAWKSDTMAAGWAFGADSVLVKTGSADDIETRTQYANFELEFDWKVVEAGNAGVFYRVTEEYDKPYWSGPEYQLLDDVKAPDAKFPDHTAASAYAVYAAKPGVTKPAGEWNSARIVVAGNFVEHWLNGQQVVQYQLTGAEWTAKVKASKFAEYPNYGLARRGFISIQGDHSGQLSIRAMRIRELP